MVMAHNLKLRSECCVQDENAVNLESVYRNVVYKCEIFAGLYYLYIVMTSKVSRIFSTISKL